MHINAKSESCRTRLRAAIDLAIGTGPCRRGDTLNDDERIGVEGIDFPAYSEVNIAVSIGVEERAGVF